MNKPHLYLLLILLAIGTTVTAQTDSVLISRAKTALDADNNCDEALRLLDRVSQDGKMTGNYFLGMARAQTCKKNYDQATYYFNKYQDTKASTDSARMASENAARQRMENKQDSKQHYTSNSHTRKPAHKKKRKRSIIDDNFMQFGISYGVALSPDNTPFKTAIGLGYSYNFPVAKSKWVLGLNFRSTFLSSPNKAWYGRLFNVPEQNVSGVSIGFVEEMNFAPMYVFVDKKNLALYAGPEVGFGMFAIPALDEYASLTFNDQVRILLTYGVQANLLVGEVVGFHLGYTNAIQGNASVSNYMGNTNTVKINHSMLKLGITVRMASFWW